jgi:hypothetical protein
MTAVLSEVLQNLAAVDPGLAGSVAAQLARRPAPVEPEQVRLLVSETLWALAVEPSFGQAVAAGYAELLGAVSPERLDAYRRSVRTGGQAGPTQGRIMAECLPPVLVHGGADILPRFHRVWATMARHGSYTLRGPLLALGFLLQAGDLRAAAAYLDVLQEAFTTDLRYEEARYFVGALPRAALHPARPRRLRQLIELRRVLAVDRRLAEPFLAGLERGLGLLGEKALEEFVAAALQNHERHRGLGTRFLALESRSGRERFAALQVSVGIAQVQDRLRRYLHARTGLALCLRPLSALPAVCRAAMEDERMVCSDGEAIYVPDEIGAFGTKDDNTALYTALVRLEASFHEFGTLDFDLQRAVERCRAAEAGFERGWGAMRATESGLATGVSAGSDLSRFFDCFPDRALSADLFTVFEMGRIRHCLRRRYPGLVQRVYPLLRATALDAQRHRPVPAFCAGLLLRVALGVPRTDWAHPEAGRDAALTAAAVAFEERIDAESPVEASAELTARFFETAAALTPAAGGGGRAGSRSFLAPPFGWRPWPNPAMDGAAAFEAAARRLQALLAAAGHAAYKSDIRRRLAANAGSLTPQDVRQLLGDAAGRGIRPEDLLRPAESETAAPSGPSLDPEPVLRYPEWDERLGDYLPEHVHVRETTAPAEAGDFYRHVLQAHPHLVRLSRQAFERMRPEGLKRLRRWRDGDEFDYRQLIDAWVDRRCGEAPSDRLFIKRVRDRREVAALLLVDVSRSTANRVPGSESSVLDIEKEAIVILCEALSVLGDDFAAAGFSGSGRREVDYYRIKDFDEPLAEAVRRRIGALRPQRNTRMGAAIRHAAGQLAAVPARVRLLIILSDGFPNDTDYKGSYALADTRQALLELNARHIRFHALTVNLPADPKLDELYGRARHHVISDVGELPGKLLRVYSALTR